MEDYFPVIPVCVNVASKKWKALKMQSSGNPGSSLRNSPALFLRRRKLESQPNLSSEPNN